MRTLLFKKVLFVLFTLNVNLLAAQIVSSEIYKKTSTRDLTLKIFTPDNLGKNEKRPAIIFFFGGGWNSRNIGQFERHSIEFSRKGMICFIADYRVYNTDKVEPKFCLMDAKSAIRYVYSNADRLNVDVSRLVASGGSAGGHLAAATRYVDGFNDPIDDLSISCKPSALVLFNPVIDNSKEGYGYDRIKKYFPQFSPSHNIKEPVPTIFFVGSEDKFIPSYLAEQYKQNCEKLRGRCDLHIFENRKHGFFTKGNDYNETVRLTEEFLVSIGYLNI